MTKEKAQIQHASCAHWAYYILTQHTHTPDCYNALPVSLLVTPKEEGRGEGITVSFSPTLGGPPSVPLMSSSYQSTTIGGEDVH